MLDLVIRRAAVVDGTGRQRRNADIGVAAGRIASVGDLRTVAAVREIDAAGMVVTPGFIDLHTHYDAQLFWDPDLTPSSLHGITTVVSGNCGFTVAPLTKNDTYLAHLLSRVEGIPLDALRKGVPWGWESTEGYFAAVRGRTSINVGLLVGHSALRRQVMGRAASERAATAIEIEAMSSLLRDGLLQGGLGFSSTRSQTHFDGDGTPVPSRWATDDEFIALAGVLAEFDGVSIETSPVASTGVLPDEDVDLMIAMSQKGGCPVNWNAMTVSAAEAPIFEANIAAGSRAAERGGRVVAMTIPMPVQVRYSFLSGVFLDALPGWDDFMRLAVSDRLERLADPTERARLNAMAQKPGPRRDQANWAALTVVEGVSTRSLELEGRTIGSVAEAEGRDPFDVLCEIVVADRLRTGLARIPDEPTDEDWRAKLKVWRDPRAVVGASDAGAHLDVLAMFNYPTWILQEVVRERALMDLEEAVALLTSVPAELYGLHDRGRLEEGFWADMVLLDESRMGTEPPSTVCDLPDGSGRIFAAATGIHQVIVAGQTVVAGGRPTGMRAGALLERGVDTARPSIDLPAR